MKTLEFTTEGTRYVVSRKIDDTAERVHRALIEALKQSTGPRRIVVSIVVEELSDD